MATLRYGLAGFFLIAVAVGLLLLVRSETRSGSGESTATRAGAAARPATWFRIAAALFAAIVVLTLLFPVAE